MRRGILSHNDCQGPGESSPGPFSLWVTQLGGVSMSDPLKQPLPFNRRAPGLDFLEKVLTPPPKPTAEELERQKLAADLLKYAGKQAGNVGQDVQKLIEAYLYPYPPGGGPPGAGAPQKKLIEDLGGLLLPKAYFKAITEIGEGNIPLVKRKEGIGLGLGVGEEDEIYRQTQRQRAELQAFWDSYYLFGRLVAAGAIATSANLGVLPPPPGSGRPLDSTPVNNLVAAAYALSQGVARNIESERSDP